MENKRVILIQAFLKGTLVTTLPIKGYGNVSSNETTGLCQKEVKWLVKYTQIKQMAKFLLTFREFVKNCFQVLIMVKTVNHIQKQKFWGIGIFKTDVKPVKIAFVLQYW